MSQNVKKLALNKETIRALQDFELRLVAGGQPQTTMVAAPAYANGYVITHCCGSSSTTVIGGQVAEEAAMMQ